MLIKIIVLLFFGVLIILSSFVSAECVVPTDEMVITQNTTFCPGEYNLPNGVSIRANNVELDCNGAKLVGKWEDNLASIGINIINFDNISVEKCYVTNYTWGIRLFASDNDILKNNNVIKNAQWGILTGNSNNNNTLIFINIV